ncbi:hypothetical protein SAMN02746065_12643 [Desulfocicer vacuolatum DSM 3385]|uniref:Uncharacterized protein n=1 Tax=Desulfocicer vacuolatum DSM 3385 TaxID=1121400 RepID=A0A1W2EA92_9BACT|nr:hypothetical protein [Desulfocicer vacuolatum]SMD05958.1 hypothetical protein SAMN02746065_12643 [Desulfocicer vacuolatum DSM 3385]
MTDQFKKLETVLDNPDSLTSISIKELKQLRRLCASAGLMATNSDPGISSTSKKIFPFNGIAVDPQKIEILKERLNQLITDKISFLQSMCFSVALLLHLFLLFWILTGHKMEILPWYLIVGSLGIILALKVLIPSSKEIHGVPLYYRLRSRHFIFFCIPMSSLVVVGLLFVSPMHLNLFSHELAIVTHDLPLSIGCGKNVFLKKTLKKGQTVVVEAIHGGCARVFSNEAGMVGYLPLEKIKFTHNNTMDQAKGQVKYLSMAVLLIWLTILFFFKLYHTKIVPALLRNLAQKNRRLLKNQLEATKLLSDIHQDSLVSTALDLQEAKTDLILKITKKYQTHADAVLDMKNMSEADKKKVLDKLFRWYSNSFES